MSIDIQDAVKNAEKIAKDINEFNAVLEKVIPVVAPEVFKTLTTLDPIVNQLSQWLFTSETMDKLIVVGNASYLARALLQNGMNPDEAATKAVACAQKIIELSRK